MQVVEKFVSINGEGTRAGELAVFIRFKGCNLSCSYCDTSWANEDDVSYEEMSAEEIFEYIKETGVSNVTLTGGEPLLQNNIDTLIDMIACDDMLRVEIETNGSVDISTFTRERVSYTMDYKLPVSGMEQAMCYSNFNYLNEDDTIKFVVGSKEDLERSLEIIKKYKLIGRCNVYFSPVFGKIDPELIVEYMKDNRLNDVRVQLQLHKMIWNPDKRGV
ncbi:MAG: putative 7-carboxy-7-deazaguanine synthase QueE [Lachnospiraceae bacterium]|nr:putative 7-carboxy-7-deazaguanine synthase QueE [Lachnospiraceae bacterium]